MARKQCDAIQIASLAPSRLKRKPKNKKAVGKGGNRDRCPSGGMVFTESSGGVLLTRVKDNAPKFSGFFPLAGTGLVVAPFRAPTESKRDRYFMHIVAHSRFTARSAHK